VRNGDVAIQSEGIETERRNRRFALWPWYGRECQMEILHTLEQGGALSAYRSNPQSGVGPKEESKVWRFEREMERRFGVKHCIATNSGTMALSAAVAGLDLPEGSEIITTALTFSATPASILLAGHVPVFADVHPDTFCIDPKSVEQCITDKTKAILPVDLFGQLAHYDALCEFGLPIIQDNCQAVGASRRGKYLFGNASCGSGNGQKNLPVGEGGWILTDDDKLADLTRRCISHGENFGDEYVGVNGRMHELVAILGYHGLLNLNETNTARRQLALTLADKINGDAFLSAPFRDKEASNVFYVFPFLYESNKKSREKFCFELRANGVDVAEGYIKPTLDAYPAFRSYRRSDLAVTHELSQKTLCILPQIRPPAIEEDMAFIAHAMMMAL